MTMAITTTMMMTTMPACNVFTQHTHRLSSTDGPRKGEQASITMTAPHALTNTYRGSGVVSYTIWCSFLYDTYPDVS